MKTNKIFSLDRYEGDLAVCLDEQNNSFDFPKDLIGLEPGSLFSADLDDDGTLSNILFLEEKTAEVKKQNKSRLTALFNRNNHR